MTTLSTGEINMNTAVFKIKDSDKPPRDFNNCNGGISVVIPVFGSEGIILELHKRLTNELNSLARDYEVIFVNDGSPDNVWAKIQGIAATDFHVKAISFRRNFGYDSALMAGLSYANFPYIVIMDDDLQHAPEDIPRLLAEIEKGFDVVYGNYRKKKHNFINEDEMNLYRKLVCTPYKRSQHR